MEAIFETLSKFWSVWGPWITVALIPTIITGLSMSPATAGAATVISKVWDVLKKILAPLSVATYKNEPGTFKVPMVKELKAVLKKGKGAAMLLVIVAVPTQSGCCAWTGTCDGKGGKILTGIIDCAKESIKTQAFHLLPVVAAIITGGAPNWGEQLDSLKVMGVEALACALSNTSQELMAIANPPEGFSGGLEAMKTRAKANSDAAKIRTYLEENNLSVK